MEASPFLLLRLGLSASPPHERCLSIVKIKTEMAFGLVLSIQGCPWEQAGYRVKALGCKVKRPTVELDV